jgi:hypothetical protein
MITAEDARFLHDLILELRPRTAIEIGVASGCSSVTILSAMAAYLDHAGTDDVWLHAFDISDVCYFDASRPTGAAVGDLTPHFLPRYRFSVGDVLVARERLQGLAATFAFIDANHKHPWATVDLLGLASVLSPGAWVALHDIRLPLLRPDRGVLCAGPGFLFDTWPGEKRQAGGDGNIGAIRLPEDPREIRLAVRQALDRPWETSVSAHVCAAVSIVPRPVGALPRADALRVLKRASTGLRPVYVCGSGDAARSLAAHLSQRGIVVSGFLDRDRSRWGSFVDGIPVQARESISCAEEPRPFIAVGGLHAVEIASELKSSGWIFNRDFVVL